MIDLKSVIKLSSGAHTVPWMRSVVFDGANAISVAHGGDHFPWWAGVPAAQPGVQSPVAVPVDAIKAHMLKSRHLHIAADHVHNAQGLKTLWDRKVDWQAALTLMPKQPQGMPVQFDLELNALDRVLVATADHDIRSYLCGVLLDFQTGCIAGTDGARVHVYGRRLPKILPKKGQTATKVIVPKDAAKWLLHSADETARVTVWNLGTPRPLVLMRTSDALVYTQGIEGSFPDYQRLLQPRSSFTHWAELNPAQLADGVASMHKLQLIDKPKMPSVCVQWAQGRVYALKGPHFVPFTCKYVNQDPARPEPLETVFTSLAPLYLQDVADCVTERATWALGRPHRTGPDGKPVEKGLHEQNLAVFDGDFCAVLAAQRIGAEPPTDQIAQPPEPAKGPKLARKPARGSKPAPEPAGVPAPPQEPAKGPEMARKPAQEAAGVPEPAAVPAKAQEPAQEPAPAPDKAPEPAKARKARRVSLKGDPATE